MIKGVVFDLDHTLFDRYATLRAVLPEMYKRMRDKIPNHLGERDFIENLIKIEKQHIYRGWGYTGEKLVEAGVFLKGTTGEEIWQCIYKHCWPVAAIKYPFTDSVLTDLRAMGLKVGLITNGSVPSQSLKLDMLKLWDFFDEVIICDDETYPAKPDPTAFGDMSKRLNLLPNELLYVGDNPLNDVRGAWNSGFIPVWVKTTGVWPIGEDERAPFEVDDVSQIPDLIRKIGR
jgi:putative hydrolase of the HAD superfamily